MKLNRILAAALVAAASVPAMAAIATPATGNGELFLVLWDVEDKVSYTKDLGIFMDDYNPNASQTFAINDAIFAGFLDIADNTAGDIKFAVIAGDGVAGAGPRRIFTTIGADPSLMGNQQLTNATAFLTNFTTANNSLQTNSTHGGADITINGTSFAQEGSPAYFLPAGPTLQTNTPGWTLNNNVGITALMRSFSGPGSGGSQTAKVDLSFWTVSQTPAGAYSVSVTPIPEAEGIAMALAGLGALSFISRRRRQS